MRASGDAAGPVAGENVLYSSSSSEGLFFSDGEGPTTLPEAAAAAEGWPRAPTPPPPESPPPSSDAGSPAKGLFLGEGEAAGVVYVVGEEPPPPPPPPPPTRSMSQEFVSMVFGKGASLGGCSPPPPSLPPPSSSRLYASEATLTLRRSATEMPRPSTAENDGPVRLNTKEKMERLARLRGIKPRRRPARPAGAASSGADDDDGAADADAPAPGKDANEAPPQSNLVRSMFKQHTTKQERGRTKSPTIRAEPPRPPAVDPAEFASFASAVEAERRLLKEAKAALRQLRERHGEMLECGAKRRAWHAAECQKRRRDAEEAVNAERSALKKLDLAEHRRRRQTAAERSAAVKAKRAALEDLKTEASALRLEAENRLKRDRANDRRLADRHRDLDAKIAELEAHQNRLLDQRAALQQIAQDQLSLEEEEEENDDDNNNNNNNNNSNNNAVASPGDRGRRREQGPSPSAAAAVVEDSAFVDGHDGVHATALRAFDLYNDDDDDGGGGAPFPTPPQADRASRHSYYDEHPALPTISRGPLQPPPPPPHAAPEEDEEDDDVTRATLTVASGNNNTVTLGGVTRLEASYDAGRYARAAAEANSSSSSSSSSTHRKKNAHVSGSSSEDPPPAASAVDEPPWRPTGRDGKMERVWPEDGRREVLYRNGTRKEVAGATSIVRFTNGDVKRTEPDAIVYYYAEARTTHTTVPSTGLEIFEFPNGQLERHARDGTKDIIFPDGTHKVIHQDRDPETATAMASSSASS